jgi:hypothetical protein
MMLGPLAIFDKSFVESLNVEEIDEFSYWFSPVCPPTLISEIIADLKHPKPRAGRIPDELVKTLARKMSSAHGAEPAPVNKLVVGDLCGNRVSMIGQVPIDVEAPHVRVNRDGTGVLIDETPQQEMWWRWASGDFSTDDEATAIAWRSGLAAVDLEELRDQWRPFAKWIGPSSDLRDVVNAVDAFMSTPRRDFQQEIVRLGLSLVSAETWQRNAAYNYLIQLGRRALVRDYAAYAASVVRLYLVFATGLARGFIGPRPSHSVDLQYLFYAPFCMVFISGDKLHRDLWEAGAVTTTATYADGARLKADLKERAARRKEMTPDDYTARNQQYGLFPEPIPGSLVNETWSRYMSPEMAKPRPPFDPSTVEPGLLEKLLAMRASFDET